MARRRTGPEQKIAVPANLQPFFSVPFFYVPLHGKGRKGKTHKPHMLHGNGRGFHKGADPWHGKGAPTGR